jgi:GDPmannose 4,6-dehydratase
MGQKALITGITGQDGSYLAELLLGKNYDVYGLVRDREFSDISRIAHIQENISLLEGDLTDETSLERAIQSTRPDEVYNLAALTNVGVSWQQATLATEVNCFGFARLLEAIRKFHRDARVFQASSCEVFGATLETPQNEQTEMRPRSPYACTKAFTQHLAETYRQGHEMFISCGILFNHDSPRRDIQFVTRKITAGAARIHHGLAKELRLGNLDVQRDWGFAGDYVKAMWLMLQHSTPSDYVIGTGKSHTVRDYAALAFSEAGLRWEDYVVVDQEFFRPTEPTRMCADISKAHQILGWKPETSFEELVSLMTRADLDRVV